MKTHLMGRVMACKVLLLMLVVVAAALIPPGGVRPAAAAPPPIERWVIRYDNAPTSSADWATALAVDGAGNVYVTGSSIGSGTSYDWYTVKYDTYGNKLWEDRYNNAPTNGSDTAAALAVDAAGNVYVTGSSIDSATYGDYATVKYDAYGNRQWVARYNGPASDWDGAAALAVDGAGNVYVTGESEGSGTGADYATVKYNSAGAELWVRRYGGGGSDRPAALAVDASANVYVTGYSPCGTSLDYATVKYNAAGAQQWVRCYDGMGSGDDRASALAVDGAGNVYVTGKSVGSGTDSDYATIKYDSSGNIVAGWPQRYNGPYGGDDEANALAVDGAGNVYVTGFSYGGASTGYDYATVKYNAAGGQQWVGRYDGPANYTDRGLALAVDGAGNVYVTGFSYRSGTFDDYATIKYNASGTEQWVATYNGPGTGNDSASALAVDGAGNVYVTGDSDGSGTLDDYATIKYGQQEPHYACHLALPGMVDPPAVDVATQFAPRGQTIDPGLGNWLCAPALKNGEGVPDTETAHLRCFDAEAAQSAPNRLVNLTTQFGELQNVLVGDRALLCAPASKTEFPIQPPPEPPEPHYLCYHITGPAVNEVVEVYSQFTHVPVPTTVGEPQLLCLPAGKNEAPIPDAPHEVCYAVDPPFPPGSYPYNVLTQFGLEEMLEVLPGNMLCVPAVKEIVEPPETPSFSLKAGAVTAPPDAILKLNTVVGGPPLVAIPGPALGLGTAGPDDLGSLSYGMEYPNDMTPFLRFSMAPDYMGAADGLPWTHVFAESTCVAPGQATGDEFDAPFPLPPPGVGNTNTQVLDENGVQDNAGCAAPPGYPVGTGAPPGDDLDALEERPPSFVDTNGDGTPERPVFFTLAPGSVTLAAMGLTEADILWSANGGWPQMYASYGQLGLTVPPPPDPRDAIDALMLYDNGDRTFNCGDWVWLSLMPGSPSLVPPLSEGDVLFVDGCNQGAFQLQYFADQLGLNSWLLPMFPLDDVDALKGELPCLTGPDSDLAIGNGKGIAGDDGTLASGEVPAAIDCTDSDDDNDGYLDQSELLVPDPLSCPAKTGLTSPGGDITYDDNNNGDPAPPMGSDPADDGPSWDSDGDGALDGAECALNTDPANPASLPTTAMCGGGGDTDGDGLQNAWEYCKWGTNPTVLDSDGDTLGDCVEAADVDGNTVVNFTGDVIAYAKAILLSTATFGRDGDFDIDGNNALNFTGDVIQEAKFGLLTGRCK